MTKRTTSTPGQETITGQLPQILREMKDDTLSEIQRLAAQQGARKLQ